MIVQNPEAEIAATPAPAIERSGGPGSHQKSRGCGAREVGIAFFWAMVISAPLLGLGAQRIYSDWAAREQAYQAVIEASLAHQRLVAAPAKEALPVDVAMAGRDLFHTACIACHGADGTGVAGLGFDLTESNFVAAAGDGELVAFLAAGRPDAMPPMPPRGGHDDLSDEDLHTLATYLRGLQDPRRMPELPEMVIVEAETTEEEAASDLAAAGGDEELAAYIASGRKLYATSCAACHGKDARGLPSLGVDLVDSEFRRGIDEDALHEFITRGRDPSDPKSLTGIAMPPKGGNPALSEDDIWDIIDFLTSLDTAQPGPSTDTQ